MEPFMTLARSSSVDLSNVLMPGGLESKLNIEMPFLFSIAVSFDD